MEFRTIKRDDTSLIAPHFRNNEFFSTSPAAGYGDFTEHELAQPCISAVEFLRTHFGVAWRVTSTYRTAAHESAICTKRGYSQQLAKSSQHLAGRAVDSQPGTDAARILLQLHADFLNRGKVFDQLRQLGINGFGIYDTFIHLDCRDTHAVPAKQTDAHGHFAFWDERSDAVKKKLLTTKPSLTTILTTPGSCSGVLHVSPSHGN